MRYVSLSLALISMPLTVAFAQPQEFRDHNYTSVEQCIERRTARSALIREWSSKGWGWTLKENLEEALAEQDPAACVYAIPAEISKRRQERRDRWATAKPPTTRENELIFESIPDCVAYYEERDDSAGRNPLAIDQGPRKECNLEAFAATQMRIREQEAEEKRRRLLEMGFPRFPGHIQ